jgi:hypothetical protein
METCRVNTWHPCPEQSCLQSHRETSSQYVVFNPQVGSLAESWRHTGSICGASPPCRVTGRVMETRRLDCGVQPREGSLAESRRHVEWLQIYFLKQIRDQRIPMPVGETFEAPLKISPSVA